VACRGGVMTGHSTTSQTRCVPRSK
jgi:hypothetical protein